MVEQTRLASGLMEDLAAAYSESQEARGTLDYLHIVGEPTQTATLYRRMIADRKKRVPGVLSSPFAVDPIDSVESVKQASQRGVSCRLLADPSILDDTRLVRLRSAPRRGQVRQVTLVPLKLACSTDVAPDRAAGPRDHQACMDVAVFDHPGLGEAMKGLLRNTGGGPWTCLLCTGRRKPKPLWANFCGRRP